jgi:putative beta-lysine N-acetyltransferase
MNDTIEGIRAASEAELKMKDRYDTIEYLDGALIQHGPLNNRVYLMKMGDARPDDLVRGLIRKATDAGYSKIFAKIPDSAIPPFLEAGFRKEAGVPGFFDGREAATFLGYYLDAERRREKDPGALDTILELSRKQPASVITPPENGISLGRCSVDDAVEMADIYQKVFPTYPFPIHDPDYLQETMKSHVIYFGATSQGRLVALASSEMDMDAKNVEMTDFATLPHWRGNRLGSHLLSLMEKAVKAKQIKTAYTIARAASPGMNITFARLGYQYGGRLINNTNISGRIESMAVWYKSIPSSPSH